VTASRTPIPATLRRRLLIEARYRCAVCRHATVHIHHIVPWRECKNHEHSNLIPLCPNCHDLADDGKIDRQALRQHKAHVISSQLHEFCQLLLDPQELFVPEFGPDSRTSDQKAALIINLRGRQMLAGCIVSINWPLIRCDICEALAPIDRCWTPQEDCMCDSNERLRTFCDFGCAQKYQGFMHDFMSKQSDPNIYTQEYVLQNSVQMVEMNQP